MLELMQPVYYIAQATLSPRFPSLHEINQRIGETSTGKEESSHHVVEYDINHYTRKFRLLFICGMWIVTEGALYLFLCH